MAIASEPVTPPLSRPQLRLAGWPAAAGLGVAGGFAALLALQLDLGQLADAVALLPASPATVALMAAGYTLAFGLRAVAWRALLTTPLDVRRLFAILQTSLLLNHALPFKAGELARPYLAMRRGLPGPEAAATALIARLADLSVLALIVAVAIPLGVLTPMAAAPLAGATALLVGVGLALGVLRRDVPAFLPAPAVRPLARVRNALRQVDGRKVAVALPFVLASWLLESCVLYGTAHLLGRDLAVETAVGATAFTVLLQVAQFTPGGVGVYEAGMTSVLALGGLPLEVALTLALVTHGLKFAYAFTFALPFALGEAVASLRGASDRPQAASRLEVRVARLWNVVNEGKPFTPVFATSILLLLALPHLVDLTYWPRLAAAGLAAAPLALLFYRFDFPLHLRRALWGCLVVFLVGFRYVDPLAVGVVLGVYLSFTVVVWGTVYYHLRIGTPWTNGLRFWRLVLENPDPTSGNFQEQVPKLLLLVLGVSYLTHHLTPAAVLGFEAYAAGVGLVALLVHQWWFRWVPPLPQAAVRPVAAAAPLSRRVIVIAIDGCRADRLREANTPCIDRLRTEGCDFTNVSTVYPARTVTCFSSMLTGAPPRVHGMRSNFAPSLGVKCDSVFAALRRAGRSGKLIGIAHLIDAFGDDVQSVTAVMDNDDIDDGLIAQAQQVLREDDPDLLVLQLLSVDQTGHARGSYYPEYLHKIEATDRKIAAFLDWCADAGYLGDATVLITADHGQGIGIGGHGHMSPPEVQIPCILWGRGVPTAVVDDQPRFITDVAPTLCRLLGVAAPADSVGDSLLPLADPDAGRPLVYVVPAHDEAAGLPAVLDRIAATAPADARVIVVDDGSTDATAAVAAAHGADVVRHERNRGLGAALRSGLLRARRLNARAAVYLDADGEYDAAEAARLLAPIERGEADYVLGSRFQAGGPIGMTWTRRLANRGFSALLSLLCGRWISDGQTGYRAFSDRALAVAEIVHDYNYAQVLTLDLLRKGMRLAEVPVAYQRRRQGRSFVSAQYLWRVPLGIARELLAD